MSLRFMDNFYAYGGAAGDMLNGVWAELTNISLPNDPDTNATGKVLKLDNFNDATTARVVIPAAPHATQGAAFRIWMSGLPSNGTYGPEFQFRDANNTPHVYIKVTSTGTLRAYRGDGTLLGETATPVLVSNAWQHVEVKVFISATVGTVDIRVEGVPVLALAGLNTANSAILTVAQDAFRNFWGNHGAVVTYIKDFILWDGAGAQNNNFIGSCIVATLVPNADVALNWTPSSGATGWNLISETPPDDDVNYISAATPPPAAYVVGMSDLPANVTSVKGLMTLQRSRKIDGGDGNIQVSVVSGGTPGNGTDRPITAAYTYWMDIFELDPNTLSAWLPAAVNAVNLKINRTV